MDLCTIGCVISLAALQAGPGPSAARPADYPRGTLIDPVVSPSDASQRYVLYLPTTADLKTPRPILYVMDYRGRGRVAAELFQPAAERLGWILMSSYNTASDTAGEPNAVALRAMWRDSHDSFAIDDRRTYLAGLSGTARTATLLAGRTGSTFAGVIGAAAGFRPEMPPSKDVRFLYYGTAGTVDYNYWEMRGLEGRLTRLGLPHRIAFFDGPHGWMPPELALAALSWMELRAMRSGDREIDRAFIDERWSRDVDRSRALEADGLEWEASRLLASMASDYAKLRPEQEVAELARRAERLGATPAAVAQARMQARASAVHEDKVQHALQVIADGYPPEANEPAVTLAKTILDLDIARLLRATASSNAEESLAARRVLAELDVQTGFYLPLAAIGAADYARASFYLGIAQAIRNDDSYAWYLRAAVEARLRQPARALAALERAIALGFRTVDALEHNASFTSLRKRPEFVRLVDALKEAVR